MANRYIRGDERERILADVAEMYYLDGLGQVEIAGTIGVTRSAVSRMLSEAREKGIVEIRVRRPPEFDDDLSGALAARFGLRHALVMVWDGGGSQDELRSRLGKAAAQALTELLKPDSALGVGWGTTVSATIEALDARESGAETVVQLVGVLRSNSHAYNSQALVDILARKLGADSIYLYAPFIVDSAETARALRHTPDMRQALNAGSRCDMVLMGVGSMAPDRNSLYLGGHISRETLQELDAAGAVGEIIGHHFDLTGSLLDIPLHERLVCVSMPDLLAIPARLAVAGGAHKERAVLGALRGGFVTGLVTDSVTAASVLALDGNP
jgi:DNA-binding transcriptional regulator LsrR (DeoR family)